MRELDWKRGRKNASGKWVSTLEEAKEYFKRARGIYTHLVTCPSSLGWEPIESFGELFESEVVGSAGGDFVA